MLNSQVDKSHGARDRSADNLRRFYQANKSKSEDTKVTGGRPGHGQNAVFKETRDFEHLRQPEQSMKTTLSSQEPIKVTSLQTYNATEQSNQRRNREVPGSPSVQMNRVNFALEKARSVQSLPSRMKPRVSDGSVVDCNTLWPTESSRNHTGSWNREQGPSLSEEVTGNQTITERIAKLYGDTHSDRPKWSKTLGRNNSLTLDSTRTHNKNTSDSDNQQETLSNNLQKAGTFPRRFSKTHLGQNLESSNNDRNIQTGTRLSSLVSVNTKKSLDPLSDMHDDCQEINKPRRYTESPTYSSLSLERTRSKLSANPQYRAQRNQTPKMDSSSRIPNEGISDLLRGTQEEIVMGKGFGGVVAQPTYTLATKGAVYEEREEKDSVFTCKPSGKRNEGVFEKFRAPSLDSVKNTISLFESLAQQGKGTAQNFQTRRTLSMPEHPKSAFLVKKSDSDKNLYFERVVEESNFFSKDFISEKPDEILNQRRTTHSNPVNAKPTLAVERYKSSVEIVPYFKQINESRTGTSFAETDSLDCATMDKRDAIDSAIPAQVGLRHTMKQQSGFQKNPQQSTGKYSTKQQTCDVKRDEDADGTPTLSPDTVTFEMHCNSGAETINGTYAKVVPNQSQNSTSLQKVHPSVITTINNNDHETRQSFFTRSTNMGRWSSDEEDFDEETDSDSGESSVTITSNMSRSERQSFSLSLVDLCNYGGVDYSLSEDEDLPCSRSASISSDISAFSSVTLLSSNELDRLLDDVRGLGDDTLQKYEDVQVVVLHKDVGSGLGFTLAGGVDQNKPVTVHKIIPGGVAAQEGTILGGARVLSINGTALQHSTHGEALRTLRKARGQGMAVVVLQSGIGRKEATERSGITGKRVRVTLHKSSSDLGFSLEGGAGSSSGDKPLTVQKIFRGGPVSEVFPGDEILAIQGQSLEGMMRLEAWNLIKKLPPGPVEVLLHRLQQPL